MRGKVDPVVGQSILRKVVRADFLAAIAGPDLGSAGRFDLLIPLRLLDVVEARAEHRHRLIPILELGTLVLAGDDHSGRDVGDPNRGAILLDVLTAGARRAIDV